MRNKNHKKNTTNKNPQSKKYLKLSKNKKAQLLLIGGVLITFLILSLSMISISIPDITRPIYKKDFINYEYSNVKEEFGVLLNVSLKKVREYINDENTFEEYGKAHFNETKEMFVYIEKTNGNYFNVEYLNYDAGSSPKTIRVRLTLRNNKENISEVVHYKI